MTTAMTILIILSTYVTVAFTIFMVRYIYNIHNDFDGAFIFAWPIAIIIWLIAIIIWLVHTSIVTFCRTIQRWWIIIGGPKIKRLSPDKRKQRRKEAYDNLNMAIHEALNAGVTDKEIARLTRDSLVKEIMES